MGMVYQRLPQDLERPEYGA